MRNYKAFVVVGMGYGDEGKGQVVDHLVREHDVHTVMRFSGGSQAAHNVVTPDGLHHTFAQFGSGVFAGADTYLGRDMMVNPLDMFNEFYHLASIGQDDAWDRLSVNKGCLVTTPIHAAANLLKEYYRRGRAHGTTGKGIGETRWARINGYSLNAGLLGDKNATRWNLGRLLGYYSKQEPRWASRATAEKGDFEWSDALTECRDLLLGRRPDLVEAMIDRYAEWAARTALVENVHLANLIRNSGGGVVLEGSQGVLLDESAGFHPHTTWADVTAETARQELSIAGLSPHEIQVVGVTRTHTTRHGHGPFPSDSYRRRPVFTADDRPPSRSLWFGDEPHNDPPRRSDAHEFGTPGDFRRSWFDAVAFRYAIGIVRPDVIAVTHLDSFADQTEWRMVPSYEYFGDDDVRRYLTTGENGEITGIIGGDIAHMECVTRRLFDCYPNAEDVLLDQGAGEAPDPLGIVDAIQRIGNVPVTIVGEGPSNYRTLETVTA